MITPTIIQIIFWIGAIGSFIVGIMMIANAHHTGYFGDNWSGGQVIFGIMLMIGGPLAVRVWCELIILFFRMNETLTEINNNTKKTDM
jgi:NADH:ubiquinone oxidoreductase subunit 6 (subunit J)